MQTYLKFADIVLTIAKLLTILIVGGMVISVLIGVFFRFVIPMPMAWPPEAARFLMVALTMIAASVAIRRLEHVGITLIVDALPRSLALVLFLFGNLMIVIFLTVFIWYSARLTLEMGPRQLSSSLGLSMTYAYASMPTGALMMLIQTGAAAIEGVQRNRDNQSPFMPKPAQTAV